MASSLNTAVRHPDSNTSTPNATHGSQTILQTQAGPSSSQHTPSATLRLRAEPQEDSHVRWAADVVDNEGMGKKSSKVCCIYHKPKEPGDSDSESDSSSDSGDDSEPDLSRAQAPGGGMGGRKGYSHNHDHGGEGKRTGKGKARKPSPNAYERQPMKKE